MENESSFIFETMFEDLFIAWVHYKHMTKNWALIGLEPTKSKFKILLEPTEFQLDALPLSYDPKYVESAGIEPTAFQVLIGHSSVNMVKLRLH